MEHYFSQNGLTACYTDTAITLFWDKPAAAGAVETYTILRNDTVADTTTKTHFTLEASPPGNGVHPVRPVAGRRNR